MVLIWVVINAAVVLLIRAFVGGARRGARPHPCLYGQQLSVLQEVTWGNPGAARGRCAIAYIPVSRGDTETGVLQLPTWSIPNPTSTLTIRQNCVLHH
jgi:hypothetical protein